MDAAPGTPPSDGGRLADRPPSSALPRWLTLALVALALAVVASGTYLAAVHVDDRYRIDHVSGVRMALAQRVNEGALYPELYDGETYGGTRFMPLPIVLHAALAAPTDDYLVSGKLLSYAATILLVATSIWLLRRSGCPTSLALALSVVILTTDAGFAGTMDMRADVLALALQLASVAVVSSSVRSRWWLAAAPIAALAFVVKLSAIWAPIAIVIWLLLRRERRRAATFTATYLAAAAALVAVLVIASDGRMLENVTGLATSGIGGVRDVLLAPYRLFHLGLVEATTAWALVPLAGIALWMMFRDRERALVSLAFVASTIVTVTVLTDVGTGRNQLLDPLVLVSILAGGLASAPSRSAREPTNAGAAWTSGVRPGDRLIAIVVATTAAWLVLSGLVVTLAPDVLASLRGEATYPRRPLSDVVSADTSVLSEDPYVPLAVGLRPIILDPFMLPRLEEARPGAIADLVGRIEAQEFDVIVLLEAVEPVDRTWWAELDLGVAVATAIAGSYEFAGIDDGYFVYTPAP